MADGKGTRWDNYMGIPKHLAEVNGEPILGRTVRLLNEMTGDASEIIVTSHDERYEFAGSRRHEPIDNKLEIDRFTKELIAEDTCFLYGDTYYTEEALATIINTDTADVLFFGNTKSIVAVKIKDSKLFEHHVQTVKDMYLAGKIDRCVGWQVYQSVTGQDFAQKAVPADKFILLGKETIDFNTPEEYKKI